MFTTLYPFLYFFAESGPKEEKSHYIKGLIFAYVPSIWSCMKVTEYFMSQCCRNYAQIEKYIVCKDRFVLDHLLIKSLYSSVL